VIQNENEDLIFENERQAPSTAKQSTLGESPKNKNQPFFAAVNHIDFSSLASIPFQNEIVKQNESPIRPQFITSTRFYSVNPNRDLHADQKFNTCRTESF
jgi:hypothetical protein